MKGLSAISKATKSIKQGDRGTWVSLYYSIDKDTVYSKDGADRYYVTDLIRPQTGNEIKEAVEHWKRL